MMRRMSAKPRPPPRVVQQALSKGCEVPRLRTTSAGGRLRLVALPLEGVVVADLTQNVAGPFCAQILGDMGAEVIKIEHPGRGDDARAWAPPWWGDESATFMALNRNKRSLALDLKQDAGLVVLKRLVARAD